jgi:repressor of nif and glnA expression
MAKQEFRRAGKYDRRIQFLEAETIVNDFNEASTGELVIKFDNFPACRLDNVQTADKEVVSNSLRSILSVDYEIRFIPGLDIKTSWVIKDLFDGRTYKIVAPVSEIGRQQGLLIKAEFVE